MAYFCTQCGSKVNPQKSFCENCGAKLILPEEAAPAAEVRPQVPADEPETDNYIDVDVPETPEYPSVNMTAPQDDVIIPPPQAASGPAPVTPMTPPVQNPKPFIQPTAGTSVIPPNAKTMKSGKSLLSVILGLAAVLVIAAAVLFLRKPKEPEISAPAVQTPETAQPEPTAFAVKTPDIQLPSIEPEPSSAPADIQQGLPYFARYNIPCDAAVNEDYNYPGIYDDGSKETAYGTLTFLNYITIPADEELIADGKENGMELEGYDLGSLSAQIDFTQSDANERGVLVTRYIGDYYDQDLLNDTYEKLTDTDGEDYYRYEVDNNGKRQYVYYYVQSEWKDWETYLEYTETDYFLFPSGYDGIIRGYVNPNCEDPSIDNEPENNFLFRLN